MSSTASLPPRPSLLDLLLTSKRAFLQSQHTYAEATEQADDISRTAVALLGHHATEAWTRRAKQAEAKVRTRPFQFVSTRCADTSCSPTPQVVELIGKRMEEENEGLLTDELEVHLSHLQNFN